MESEAADRDSDESDGNLCCVEISSRKALPATGSYLSLGLSFAAPAEGLRTMERLYNLVRAANYEKLKELFTQVLGFLACSCHVDASATRVL